MKLPAAVFLLTPFAASAVTFLPFYVGDKQYRYDKDDAPCKEHAMCSYEEHRGAAGQDYSLNYVEIKDNGDPFDNRQLEAARAQVRAARANGQQPTVFIYIHGWHNNAGERTQKATADCGDSLYDGDVAKFRNCGLKVIAESSTPTAPGAPPRVVGIYLAWHGTDFGWPPFYYVPSYPFRRHYARKVGEEGMARALRAIFAVIQEDRDSYFVLAMGHSFGARVLETAAEVVKPGHPQAGIIRKLRSAEEPLVSKALVPRLPVDLIFYVNAATSNSVSRKTIEDWREKCKLLSPPVGCDKNPLYLAVSSRADVLTAIVMPIANVVFFAPATDQYHLIAAANTPWMQTHKIPEPVKECQTDLPEGTFCFAVPASDTLTDHYQVNPKPGKTPAIFWDMNSDHWIASVEGILHSIPILRKLIARHWVISAHGDVWNTGVFNMVRSVLATEELKTRSEVQRARERLREAPGAAPAAAPQP